MATKEGGGGRVWGVWVCMRCGSGGIEERVTMMMVKVKAILMVYLENDENDGLKKEVKTDEFVCLMLKTAYVRWQK